MVQHSDIDHTGLTGVGAGTDPQFTTIELGHASDTTIARASAGNLTVEGNAIYRAGGTDVPVTDGGTGASSASSARSNLGISAANTPITDTGGYFTGTDVEAALQELGAGGPGGGAVSIAPSVFKTYGGDAQNTATWSKSITSIPTTRRAILCVASYNRDVNLPTLSNATIAELLAVNFSTGMYVSVFLITPTSASGTTLGITATGANWIIADIYEIDDLLTGSVITSATLTDTNAQTAAGSRIGPITPDVGDFYVVIVGQNDGSTGLSSITMSAGQGIRHAITPGANAGLVSCIGRATAEILAAVYAGGTSGGDMAAGIVTLS